MGHSGEKKKRERKEGEEERRRGKKEKGRGRKEEGKGKRDEQGPGKFFGSRHPNFGRFLASTIRVADISEAKRYQKIRWRWREPKV